jgi:hypothetical protein
MLQRTRIRIILLLSIISLVMACNPSPGKMEEPGESLDIYPDYASIVIPPNIAPLNFQIRNEGKAFIAEISNSKDRSIRVRSRKGSIEIPKRAWEKLLDEDRGGSLVITVCKKSMENRWVKLAPVRNEISTDEIDPYIAFRKIPTANILWKNMGIYQRSLENFRETPIMVNNLTGENCMNCHSFNKGDPEEMLFHMRGPYGGTVLTDHQGIHFVNTNSEHTRSAGAYPSWHPGGELIAFSVNKINQGFHARIGKSIFVVDKFSDIILYDVKENSITRPAELATDMLENFPVWSNDGRKLYYIITDKYDDTRPRESILYNLMQIGFDVENRKFGTSDTLISAKDFGKSITFPRESSSKGLISFIGVDYGYFSIYNQEADVYFYHTETGEITKPGINSEFTESYPSWSGNGSWLMFVSKRDDGILSQPWFSHIDENGNAAKPFVLPQRHPDFYSDYLYNYNRPEFISGKVMLNPRKVLSVARRDPDQSGFNQAASVSVTSGATVITGKPETVFYNHD